MEDLIPLGDVNDKIICLRNQNVILDNDVAKLYGVETKEVNQAVRNNPEKFPEGYIFTLQSAEKQDLVKNFDRFESIKRSTVTPRAFTEKGLYMLATVLKSPQATQTTLGIVEAFAKLRELSRNIATLSSAEEPAEVRIMGVGGVLPRVSPFAKAEQKITKICTFRKKCLTLWQIILYD